MLIVQIYEDIRKINLVKSRYEFSEGWLGRCRSYHSAIVSAKREPSIAALTTLKVRIEAVLRQANDKSAEHVYSAEDERRRLTLKQIECAVERVIEERCAVEVPDATVTPAKTSSNLLSL